MSQNQHSKLDGRETLRLTKWELENLHLPLNDLNDRFWPKAAIPFYFML